MSTRFAVRPGSIRLNMQQKLDAEEWNQVLEKQHELDLVVDTNVGTDQILQVADKVNAINTLIINNHLNDTILRSVENLIQTPCTANMKVFQLSNNNLTKENSIRVLQAVAKECMALETLSIDHNNIDIPSLNTILEAVPLKVLCLRWTSLDANDVSLLSSQLAKTKSLKKFILEETELGEIGAKNLFKGLSIANSVEYLSLRKSSITQQATKSILKYLLKFSALKILCIPNNGIGGPGLGEIAPWLEHKNLVELDLAGNDIGCYGARIVANMLTDNGTLERLSLRMNNIQDTGAGLIATALLSNSTIEYLSLSQNRITDEGGMAIARAAGNNTSLQSLDLVGNEITDKCAEFFIELGKSTRSIHSLGIGFNLLSDIYSEKINTIFEIKSILHSLDLSLRQIPQVFQEFNQASLNYLRELKISGESAYRYKILVVGAECVGKTSLVKNIMGTQWSAFEEKCYAKPGFLKKRYSVTDGIDVHRWIPSNSQVVLNVWDFGGHELYQTTHQFFLTPRTIYAVVFDGRVDLFCNKIVEWLNCIQSRSPGEVVVLVGTHFDKKAAKAKANEINEQLEQLLADISRITSSENQFQILRTPEGKIFWQTCTKTGREFGVQELVQTLIEEGKQRAAEVKVPHSWLELRKRITSLRNGLIVPVIDYNVMVGLAAEHKIFGPHVDLACKLLQDWSEILIVPQRLHQSSDAHSELIIIDPRWMIDVFESLLSLKDIPTKEHTIRPSISKLITKALKSSKDIKELYLEKKGKLESDATTDTVSEYLISREELENNWREKQIPENFFGALMDLLQFHFELIAEVEPKQYLAPCLMRNETEPSVVSKFWSLEKLQVKEVFRQYDFPFLPYGFFSRLCVEIIQRDRTTWNNIWHVTHIWGTGLEIARTDSQLSSTDRAKIEIYHPNNSGTNCSLYIRTRGCGKKAGGGMIVLVHHIVMQLLQDYSGLSSRIRIYVGIRSPNAKESIVLSRQDCIGNILLHKSVNPELAWLIPELFPSTVSKDGGMDGTERNLIASKEQYKHEVVLRRELGSGISGAVYEGTWLGQHVAIKIPHIDHSSIYRIDDFFQEVELLRSLDHPNILKFFYRYHSPPVVIVEFCGGGDLLCVLTANTHISDVLVIRISLDIAEALSYLHNHQPPILHGDVRPPNVLIKQLSPYAEVTAVLADVGNAQIADPITLTWNDKTTATDMSGFIAILEQLLVCMEAQSESDSESSTQSNEFGTTEKLYALKDQCKENLEFPFATVAKTLRELFTIHENHYLEKRGRDKQRPKPKGGKGRYKEIKTQLCAAIERQDFELICGVLRVAHSRIPFDSNNYRWVKFSHIIFEYLTSLTLNGESAKLQEIFEIGFVDVSEPLAGNYLLHYAAESGHLNCLKTISKMLGTNPDICTKTVSGNTPLHLAVSQGHTNCAQYLIKTNASVNALDNKHQTPILKATRSAFYDCIQLLLTNNANPNIQNMLGESPLSIAAGFVHSFDPKNDPNFRCVILLLCNNADIPLSIDKHSKNVIRSAAKILLSSYWTSVLINPKIQNHLHNVLEASSPTTTETPVTNDTQSEFSDFDAYSLAEEDI